ncbi:ATP-dependent zinc metalloprotease FtsH [bacterium]|nr:ATP-dependent zinc metalloprotease FtsH [bacterium]
MVLVIAGIYTMLLPKNEEPKKVDISKIVTQIKNNEVDKIIEEGSTLTVVLKGGEKQISEKNPQDSLVKDYGIDPTKVNIEYKEPQDNSFWGDLILSLLPFALIVGFFFFIMRSAQMGSNQAMSFGKSTARLFGKDKQNITFKDVAGSKEAKEDLLEIVEFLKTPKKFLAMGAKIPKGVLMVGSPGTGKTLMAKAVAGEAGVPFFSISGSEFVEMFVGVGASRVRDLFQKAKRNAPCIIFIDEIDAVGRQRGTGMGGSHDEREQTLNQILVEMDGFDTTTNVIVVAATNRPDVLDPALLRPGRFDRRVTLELPDIKDREEILNVHVKNKPLEKAVDLNKIAQRTSGFSGADLSNLVNEAAILTARLNKKKVGMDELTQSIEKVMLGPERKSKVLSSKERNITAYHEAGHALVARMLPNCDPVHKISIISRGMAAGYTWNPPTEDQHMYSRSYFMDDIAMMLGGRVAEEEVFNEITTGAESDLRRATKLARRMVTEFGMSKKLGPLTFGHKEELVFLGRDMGEHKNYSERVASEIDDEIAIIMNEAHEVARKTIHENLGKLKEISEKLLKEETIEEVEFESMFTPKKVEKQEK